jgi:hypothetical protein
LASLGHEDQNRQNASGNDGEFHHSRFLSGFCVSPNSEP